MGFWSYPIPEGGKRMTLIELSINMAKTAPAKTCTFHTDWKKCCHLFWIIQDLTKAEEALRRNNTLAPGRCTK